MPLPTKFDSVNQALACAVTMLEAIADGKNFDNFEFHHAVEAMKQARKDEPPATEEEALAYLFRVRQYLSTQRAEATDETLKGEYLDARSITLLTAIGEAQVAYNKYEQRQHELDLIRSLKK